MTTKIILILAKSQNNVIGVDGAMPWHYPEELQHFKDTTMGKVVVMGRKTWESLPIKPLPGRINVVLTSQKGWSAEGAITESTVQGVLDYCKHETEIYIIGGRATYDAFIGQADEAIVSIIDKHLIDHVSENNYTLAPKIPPEWSKELVRKISTLDGTAIEVIRFFQSKRD
jgi:dihydrofolate reductase